ncbi:RNA pseudouridine synthase [Eikenella longinqua]|uniref:Pseudouridine synthase n=1 Tax=Eikenella longinqua TaxID=1795827 RepID=A0A1A9RXT0_9NEIS|nr:23S rRNA pseudouridine(1911/1915/1917) synthase RluD [Eikenella longinqua]OAM27898.1 RNA pseudouridine synthase [Eikenella longinqua]
MQNISSYSNNDADYNDDFDFSAEAEAENCINLTVPTDLAGQRLDAALAKLLPDYSRSRLSAWIKDGAVLLGGERALPKERLIGGEKLEVHIQPSYETQAFQPEPMPLDIVFEDDSVIVLNKPAGLVVHPAAGNWSGTLLNGLLAHCPALSALPRAGIVHRLDKDTSGLMVVAKTPAAQNSLVQQLQARSVKRIYRAVADGIVPFDGKIDTLIGRDPHNRLKMAVVEFGGKRAVTHVKVLERYQSHSYIECALETGRTHQIRVHLREANHPLAADPVYGNPRHPASEAVKEAVRQLARQALHAYRLSFTHPESGQIVQFEAPLPEDIHHLLSVLRWECGMDSPLSHNQPPAEPEDEDDWNDDDYDVETIYVRD